MVGKKTVTKTAVVVSTLHKGIFFGWTETVDIPETKKVRLDNAQMCVSFHSSIRGFMGLASCGPNAQCRVSWKVPSIEVSDVTSIVICSENAVKNWELAKWA